MTLKLPKCLKLEVCVCPKCKWIYITDKPVECDNKECSDYEKKGNMCEVIEK